MGKRDTLETVIYGVALWALAVAALLIWQLVPTQREDWAWLDRVLHGIAAAGTVGAVAWGFWSARRQKAEQARREYDEAVILAAGICDQLRQAHTHLQMAQFALQFYARPDGGHKEILADLDDVTAPLIGALSAPAFHHDFETIAKLAPLPGNCAVRLSKVQSMVKALQNDVDGKVKTWHASAYGIRNSRNEIWGWLSPIDDITALTSQVGMALERCLADADIALTDEEIAERYGWNSTAPPTE